MKAILQSNKICVTKDDCHSVVIKYRNQSNAFNFDYTDAPQDFYQQMRVSGYIRTPSYQITEKIYRRHDGTFKNTGVTVDKKYLFLSDQFDEVNLDALVVASKHDEFIIDDIEYNAQGDITIVDNEGSNLATAQITIYEQGFNQGNVSC